MPTSPRTKCYVHEVRQPLELPYEPHKYHLCVICQIRLLEIAKTDFRFECSKQMVKISLQPELQKKAV